jgi:hypothetical protein
MELETLPCLSSLVDYLEQYSDIDGLLTQLARFCIHHNLYRQGNTFYYFSEEELEKMNACSLMPDLELDGGFMFLFDPNSKEGMVQLYSDACNPKWTFDSENNKITIDHA